jgi:hypothetical protein
MGHLCRQTWARRMLNMFNNTKVYNYACVGYQAYHGGGGPSYGIDQQFGLSASGINIPNQVFNAGGFTGNKVTIFHVGSNDLANNSSYLPTLKTNIATLVALAAAYGPVFVATVLPRSDSTPNASFITDMQAYNAWLKSTWQTNLPGCTGIIDYTQSYEIYGAGTAADVTPIYYADNKAHPNDNGAMIMAGIVAPTIAPYLISPGPIFVPRPTRRVA